MPGKKFCILAFIFIITAAVLIPAPRIDIASAKCSWMNDIAAVQLFNNPHDYRWEESWNPRYDPDWQTNYGNTSRDYDVRCDLAYGCPTCGGQGGSTTCR